MALASLADVKRILRLTTVDAARDAQLLASLAAIESLYETKLRFLDKEGNWVEAYFDVFEDATLYLPSRDGVVTLVKVFEYPSSIGVPLSSVALGRSHGYELTDTGMVILRPSLFVSPFEGASATRRLRTYSRVEIHYRGTGQIPAAVTEGIALLAAGHWKITPSILESGGLKSEKIGDYSYTTGDTEQGEQPDYVIEARRFLGPYLAQRRHVSVT